MDIFQKLIKQKVPFAVVVWNMTFRLESVNEIDRRYMLIIMRPGPGEKYKKRKFKKLGFNYTKKGDRYFMFILERYLTQDEIEEFKSPQIQEQFNKVLHTPAGRVFELKSNPFKLNFDITFDNIREQENQKSENNETTKSERKAILPNENNGAKDKT